MKISGKNMSIYVALLRGLNVGKGNRISMADLRSCLQSNGLENVHTLLSGGNVVFRSEGHLAEKLRETIGRALASRYMVNAHEKLACRIHRRALSSLVISDYLIGISSECELKK